MAVAISTIAPGTSDLLVGVAGVLLEIPTIICFCSSTNFQMATLFSKSNFRFLRPFRNCARGVSPFRHCQSSARKIRIFMGRRSYSLEISRKHRHRVHSVGSEKYFFLRIMFVIRIFSYILVLSGESIEICFENPCCHKSW